MALLLGLCLSCSAVDAAREADTRAALPAVAGATRAGAISATSPSGLRSAAGDVGVSVLTVLPEHPTPGTPLRISIDALPTARVSGRFLERELVFLSRPAGEGRIAFAGIDLDVAPGVYVLSVEVAEADGRSSAHALDLTVEPKQYPTERLEVESKYVQPPPAVQERISRESALLSALWAVSSAERLFDGRVVRPLAGVQGRNFGRRRVFNGQPRSPHSGADLSAVSGTPVEASAAGTVVVAQNLYFSGNLVVLDHGGGVYTLYAHLSSIGVEVGEQVPAGEIVGKVGATGRVTGPHLHWGARIGAARVEPQALLDLLTFEKAGRR